MKRLVSFAAILASVGTLAAQRVEVHEEILSNGLKLLIVERRESPTVVCGWVVHVGSVNERPGITGMAHLFEHMMFKGTRAIGIKDYERGMEIQLRQDEIRAEMEKEYAELREKLLRGRIEGSIYDAENMTPRLRELRAELVELFEEEKQAIVPTEIDQIYTREGGSSLNAFTTEDQTAYFVNLPSNKLELWFWLESDRLLEPVFREFYAERDVVREERRLRVESTPTGRLDEQFSAMFWQSAPYSWPVIGWASDVESITRGQAEEFFDVYYAPNNITAVLVGDVDTREAVALAERYFGRIPRGEVDPPPVITFEVEQLAERRLIGQADTNPSVTVRFPATPFNHRDTFALQLLSGALSGRTGRLYQALVEEKQVAVGQPSAGLRELKYGGYLQVSAEVKEERTHRELEDALLEELRRLTEEPLSERELQKLKNQELADSFRRLQNNFFLLIQLLIYDSFGDWRYINEAPGGIQAVTAEEIKQVAGRYLAPEKRNVAWYLRREGAEPEDPELAALPEQMRPMVRQQLAAIDQETDPEKLEQGLSRTLQMMEQVPPEVRPAVEYIARKIRERIEALSGSEEEN
jgi:predicted Zn-dependent peptidase